MTQCLIIVLRGMQGGVFVSFVIGTTNNVQRGSLFGILVRVTNAYPNDVSDVTIAFSGGPLGSFYIEQSKQQVDIPVTVAFVEAAVNTYRVSFPMPAKAASAFVVTLTMGSPPEGPPGSVSGPLLVTPTIVTGVAQLPSLSRAAIVQTEASPFLVFFSSVSPCYGS